MEVTVNLAPITVRYIVVDVPDPAATDDEGYVSPLELEIAAAQVRIALNRWAYDEPR